MKHSFSNSVEESRLCGAGALLLGPIVVVVVVVMVVVVVVVVVVIVAVVASVATML